MVTQKFKVVTVDIVNPADYPLGIIKDTFIWEHHTTLNYGDEDYMQLSDQADGIDFGERWTAKNILEIQMPESKDITGLDEIIKVELVLTLRWSTIVIATWMLSGIVEIPDNFDEGTGGLVENWCNWTEYIDGLIWSRGNGCKSNRNIDEVDGIVYDTYRFDSTAMPSSIALDLTDALSLGDKKRFAIFTIDDDVRSGAHTHQFEVAFGTKESASVGVRPILRITYRDYSPEGFDTQDNRLSIVPNPDDRRLPIFSWGEVSADDLEQYKFYYKATAFSLPTDATWLATVLDTSATSYLGSVIDLVPEDTTRYFRTTAEDSNNLNDDSLISNIVSMIRPSVQEAESNRTVSVGDTVTLSTICTNAGTPVKKVFLDWGDTDGYWVTMETEFTTALQTFTHVYSKKGVYAVKIQFEGSPIEGDEEIGGYYSDMTDICTVTVDDTYPRAILTARPLEVIYGEYIRLNASLSHPISSDVTLTYRFYKDGAPLAAYQSSPIYSYQSLVGDIPHAHFTCYVKTSGGIESALSNDEIVYVIADAPTLLSFSRNTKITSRGEARQSTVDINQIDGGTGEIDVRSGVSNITISLEGISAKGDMAADLAIIKAAVEGYTYVQLTVYDETCGSHVHYNGRMISYRLNKTSARYVSWSVEFRVNSVTS